MTTPTNATDTFDLPEELAEAPVQFWTCLNRDHKTVTWQGDIASCGECGLTSDMTRRRDKLVAERVRADERTHIAAMVRHYFAASDDPLCEDVRILCGRIERGEHSAAPAPGEQETMAPEQAAIARDLPQK
ncbi:hypothetical protein GCM10022252_76260 [Streptosporangium oxazolinicum]|uniref:Ferredoxin n=1 Tax=Streptosporangium oxazolinicum TaxID=909287 RepID=A0ABP8BL26_9ACTN